MEGRTLLHNQSIINQTTNNYLGTITRKFPIYCPPRLDFEEHIRSLTQIVLERADQGMHGRPRDLAAGAHQMRSTPDLGRPPRILMTTIYNRLISQAIRQPGASSATSKNRLPSMIGSVDFPAGKKQPIAGSGIDLNIDVGVYCHVLLVIPPNAKFKGRSAQDHFAKNDKFYRRNTSIARIDVRPVPLREIKKTMQYCLKETSCRDLGLDEGLLILPRALSELCQVGRSHEKPDAYAGVLASARSRAPAPIHRHRPGPSPKGFP